MILSLVNVKGGVGKTTTAVNLAAAYAGSGLDVLLVDLDPQGSASYSLGVPRGEVSPSAAQVLLGEAALDDALWQASAEGVDLVPGDLSLAAATLALARRRDPEKLLAKALAPAHRRYDLIVIDCPPGLSILTLNALAASTAFIVPVVPHDLDLEALERFVQALPASLAGVRRKPQLLGIVLTMVDHRTRLTEEVAARIRRQHGRDVFRTEIPINVRLAEAPRYGRTIFQFEKWSPGGRAYSRLGAETLQRARKQGLV